MTHQNDDWQPEFGLVVLCSTWPHTPERLDRIRESARQVRDWSRFVSVSERHRVSGLVQVALEAARVDPPEPFGAELKRFARESAVHELTSVSETIRLSNALRDRGLDPLVLKGPTIALAAFGRYGVRYSMDIDLLVAKSDVPAAEQLLLARGYVRQEPAFDADAAAMRARMARYKDLVFRHPESDLTVELHWRLFQNPWLMRGVGHDAADRTVQTIGAPITVLRPDIGLLYLCVHGGEHAWARLKWLADLGAFLLGDAPKADALYARARSAGLSRWVGPGMLLSAEMFATAVPDKLREDVARDWRMRWLLDTARASLVGDQSGAELEQMPGAPARKNLGHYLASSDPRYWFMEAKYDVLDGASSDGGTTQPAALIWRRLKGLLRSLATRAR